MGRNRDYPKTAYVAKLNQSNPADCPIIPKFERSLPGDHPWARLFLPQEPLVCSQFPRTDFYVFPGVFLLPRTTIIESFFELSSPKARFKSLKITLICQKLCGALMSLVFPSAFLSLVA